MLDS
jgi:hypothetical protein